jgi:tetratricopeptide (TPR) repeat protein
LGKYAQAFDTITNNINDFLALRGYNAIHIELYSQLVQLLQQDKDEQWRIVGAFTALGNAYTSLRQYQQAIDYCQQLLNLRKETGDK